MISLFRKLYSYLNMVGDLCQPILLLFIRLFWGGSLMFAGWGKLQNIDSVSEFFLSLDIPYPLINSYAVAWIECIGGACFMIGLLTRVISIPLICVMLGALIFAHPNALAAALYDSEILLTVLPFTYLMATLIVFAFGAGTLSCDYVLLRSDEEGV